MTSATSCLPHPQLRSATFSSTQLQALRARVNGRVFVPGDDGYDNARQTWNVTTFDQRPAIVVMPSISADVVSAVSFAREHNLPIAAQGGGHGHPLPANDALLVNFANMASVQITPGRGQRIRRHDRVRPARHGRKRARSGTTSSPPRIRTDSRRSTALPGRSGSLATCSAAASDGWCASTARPQAAFDPRNW